MTEQSEQLNWIGPEPVRITVELNYTASWSEESRKRNSFVVSREIEFNWLGDPADVTALLYKYWSEFHLNWRPLKDMGAKDGEGRNLSVNASVTVKIPGGGKISIPSQMKGKCFPDFDDIRPLIERRIWIIHSGWRSLGGEIETACKSTLDGIEEAAPGKEVRDFRFRLRGIWGTVNEAVKAQAEKVLGDDWPDIMVANYDPETGEIDDSGQAIHRVKDMIQEGTLSIGFPGGASDEH